MDSDQVQHETNLTINTDVKQEDDNEVLLKKREDQEDQKKPSQQLKILMPSLEGAYVKKEEFSNFQNKDIKDQIIEKYYKKYQEYYKQRYFENFFYEHHNETWFEDKYNPRSLHVIEISRKNYTQQNFNKFIEMMSNTKGINLNTKQFKIDQLQQIKQEDNLRKMKTENLDFFKESELNQFIKKNYYQLENVPKNLGQVLINDQLSKMEFVESFQISEALRHKEYERFGFVMTAQGDKEEMQKQLDSIEFNYANIKFIYKELKEHKILIKNYQNEEDLLEDYHLYEQILNRMMSFYGIKDEKAQEFNMIMETLQFMEKFDFITLLLLTVFQYVAFKMKIYKKPMKLLLLGANMLLREGVESTQEKYNEWKEQNKQVNDIKALKLENFNEQIINIEQQLQKAEQAIEDKVFSRLKEKLKEDSNCLWPCIKCEKYYEDQESLLNHFTQKHSKSVEKYQKKIFDKEVYKNFFNDQNKHFYIEYKQTYLNYVPFNKKQIYEELMNVRQREIKRKPHTALFEYENL